MAKLTLDDLRKMREEKQKAMEMREGANKDVLRRIWDLGFDNFATDDPLVLFELLPELKRGR